MILMLERGTLKMHLGWQGVFVPEMDASVVAPVIRMGRRLFDGSL